MAIDRMIAYCGVNCAQCPDDTSGKCPGCRNSEWGGDPCMPVACCQRKGIEACGQCGEFPCESMAEFYTESEGHREAYQRMLVMRK